MQKIRQKIIVLTDFSPSAHSATDYALRFAHKTGATLYLLYAADINDTDSLLKEAELEFAKLLTRLSANDRSIVETHVIRTDQTTKLVNRIAEEQQASLLIMGAVGLSGIDKLFGSFTTEVIRHSKIPVIAVPENAGFRMGRIVFASDYKEIETRVEAIKPYARLFSSHIHVLHVREPGGNHQLTPEEKAAIARNVHMPELSFSDFEDEGAADGIFHYLQQKHADLLVLFPGDRSWFERLTGKSVTRELALKAVTPMLTFPIQ